MIVKYNEKEILEEIHQYIKNTYEGHYSNSQGIQVFDIWESLGSLDTTARDNVIKYVARFGRKEGHNIKDLYKAIHYIIMMIHCYHNQKKD